MQFLLKIGLRLQQTGSKNMVKKWTTQGWDLCVKWDIYAGKKVQKCFGVNFVTSSWGLNKAHEKTASRSLGEIF